MDGGYGKKAQKERCKSCKQENKGRICEARVTSFPKVMEIRLEYQCKELQNSLVWRELYIPRRLTWLEIPYMLVGVILRDPTEGVEHFSTCLEVNNKLYRHKDDAQGLMSSINAAADREATSEGFSLSAALPAESKDVPSRFYYAEVKKGYAEVKKGDNLNGSEWTDVQREPRPARAGLMGGKLIQVKVHDDASGQQNPQNDNVNEPLFPSPKSLGEEVETMSTGNDDMPEVEYKDASTEGKKRRRPISPITQHKKKKGFHRWRDISNEMPRQP
jgi:hypothetical protein